VSIALEQKVAELIARMTRLEGEVAYLQRELDQFKQVPRETKEPERKTLRLNGAR
jgi:hypothetical protein